MKRMNKKGFAPLVILALAFLVGAVLISSGVLDTGTITGSGAGGYIERPIFKYIKCEAIGGLKYSQDYTIADAGEWLNKPSVSSSYNIKFKVSKVPGVLDFPYAGSKIVYSICNSQVNSKANCRVYENTLNSPTVGTNYDVNGLKNNEVVFAKYLKYNAFGSKPFQGATYQIGFVPYGLREYDVLSGSANPVNPNDCIDARADQSSWSDRLLGSDSSKVNGAITSKSINEKTLQPEEVRWYVSGYVSSAGPSFALTYKGQSAWCRSTGTTAEIYKINTITLGSGNYKIASPDYSDLLGSEKCCPGSVSGSSVCQSDFTYKSIVDSSCGGFQACGSPNWVPSDSKTLIKYFCNSKTGKCESQTKKVNCANDADCNDANKVCDLNSYNCVNANVNLDGQVIKTIPDNIADCAAQGGTWRKTSETQKTGLFCFFGQGLCSENIVINEYCDNSGPNYVMYLFLVIVIIGLIILYPYIRMTLKGIPVIGKVIP